MSAGGPATGSTTTTTKTMDTITTETETETEIMMIMIMIMTIMTVVEVEVLSVWEEELVEEAEMMEEEQGDKNHPNSCREEGRTFNQPS